MNISWSKPCYIHNCWYTTPLFILRGGSHKKIQYKWYENRTTLKNKIYQLTASSNESTSRASSFAISSALFPLQGFTLSFSDSCFKASSLICFETSSWQATIASRQQDTLLGITQKQRWLRKNRRIVPKTVCNKNKNWNCTTANCKTPMENFRPNLFLIYLQK